MDFVLDNNVNAFGLPFLAAFAAEDAD